MKQIFDKKSERDFVKGIKLNAYLNTFGVLYFVLLSALYGFHIISWSFYSNLSIPIVIVIVFSRLNVNRLCKNYKNEMELQFEGVKV